MTSTYIAGVDEAGRGCLCGDVFSAAVILDPKRPIAGLNDSKKLSAKQRDQLFDRIILQAVSYCVARASVQEIDEMNILQASLLSMQRAIVGLSTQPTHALIDGSHCPKNLPCTSEAIIKGDSKIPQIAAASILAKVARDRYIIAIAEQYPQYGLIQHKGYPTKIHKQALSRFGPTPIHRYSFKPVRQARSGFPHKSLPEGP